MKNNKSKKKISLARLREAKTIIERDVLEKRLERERKNFKLRSEIASRYMRRLAELNAAYGRKAARKEINGLKAAMEKARKPFTASFSGKLADELRHYYWNIQTYSEISAEANKEKRKQLIEEARQRKNPLDGVNAMLALVNNLKAQENRLRVLERKLGIETRTTRQQWDSR